MSDKTPADLSTARSATQKSQAQGVGRGSTISRNEDNEPKFRTNDSDRLRREINKNNGGED